MFEIVWGYTVHHEWDFFGGVRRVVQLVMKLVSCLEQAGSGMISTLRDTPQQKESTYG